MKTTLCTLFEGHYHYGVAALVNSLVAARYEGIVWVGYRGPLPSWIVDHPDFDGRRARLPVTPQVELRAIELDPPFSLNYYKPTFMCEILERHAPDSSAVTYLDPDLVVKCNWAAIEHWLRGDGVALVEDLHGSLPAHHPRRLSWQHFFSAYGEAPCRELDRYYNSGFVGVPRARAGLLSAWQRICAGVVVHGGGEKRQRKIGGPASLFHSTDEDALNFALTLCDAPLHTAGPEAMDFTPGGRHLSHAVGAVKPWQGRHLRRALRGQSPTVASRWYYRFADGPLRPFSAARLARRRLSMRLATALGRVYQRA